VTGPAGEAVVAAALAPVVVAGAGAGPRADGSAVKADVALLGAGALHPLESPLADGDLGPGATPRVAPGIVLALGAPVAGPGATAGAVLAATTSVYGALAVHEDGAVTRLVVGRSGVAPAGLDLGLVGVLFERDGVQLGTAAGAASFGHPAAAAAAAADALAAGGAGLEAGWLVWCGALLPPADLAPGSHARAAFGHLGIVTLRRR
jgi:2-keto-4-pentenoate hydratase